jgi:Bacteriophage clamp loader A subunit
MISPFDFTKSINETKVDILADSSHVETDYVPFIVNRNFSLFIDTLFDANEMNQRPYLSSRMQYDYLRLAIRPRKRFSPWPKNKKNEDAFALSQLFSVSFKEMVEILGVINNEQVMELKSLLENMRECADGDKQRG